MIKILLSKKLGEMRLTQADLARATGIRPNTINELYHELADRVNLEHLDLICEALDCELDELIVRVPNKESAITHTRQGTQKPGRRGNRCNGYLLLKRGFPLFILLLLNYNPMNRTNNLYQIPYLCNLAIQFQHNG